ncbi:MAG: YaaA family protein [Mycobacteriales bacterium]
MLVLLPPSEGKASGVDGPPLDLDALSFPALTRTRKKVLTHLVRAAKRQRPALQKALQLSEKQLAELDKDRDLLVAATLPALDLYTGIVYDNLSYATLPAKARRRADESLVVASALFGLLRPRDRVPPYRLSGGTTLPGLGGLAPVWRPALEKELAQQDFVVDLRSGAYANLARVPAAVEVRVLRDEAGKRTVVSHDNKWTKGQLARALCLHGARSLAEVAEIGRTVCDAVEVHGRRVDLLLHGLASARS